MQWVCGICGYVHDDAKPPETCPVCGAPKSMFSEWYDDGENLLGERERAEETEDVDDFYGDYDE